MSTTTHPFAPEEIMAFVDGELSADRAQALSAHIVQCADCKKVKDSLRNTSLAFTSWTVTTVPSALQDQVIATSAKIVSQLDGIASGRLPWSRHWTRKRWLLTLATTGCAFLLLLAISIPNLLRSKIAANEASAIGRQRRDETKRFTSAYTAMVGGKPNADQKSMNELVTLTPEITDSNDVFHRLGDHAKDSFSVDDQEATDSSHIKVTARSGLAISGPMIARTVSLSIVAKEFDASRATLEAILARHNGYAAALNVSTPQGAGRTIQASLRIPAPQLVAAVAELKALGRVENETQNGEEVTHQHADLVARLKNSRETEQRLQDVLRTRTGKVKDVLEVEEEIARVRGEIEEMEAEQQTLEHRVSFATIDLKLGEEYKAQLTTPAPSVGMQLRNATVNGFRSALEGLLALVLFLAESVPTLLLWLMILAFPVWWLWRRYRRALAAGLSVGV
jgi:anti-sigma factor RsiW